MKNIFYLMIALGFSLPSFAANCDLNTKEELQEYIKTFANTFPTSNYAYSGRDYDANDKAQSFLRVYQGCEEIINLKGMGKCFQKAAETSKMLNKRMTGSPGSMRFELSDSEYHASVEAEAKSLPEELSNGIPADWRRIVKKNGWKAIQYRSRTVPNSGNSVSYNRVLILVEGTPYDKYVQFTLGDPDPSRPERLVDFISIDKRESKIFFTQFFRQPNGTAPQNRHEMGQSLDSCFICHPNGMRELSPAPGSYSKEDAPNLDIINKKMTSYGKINWGVGITIDAYGPTMGTEQGCMKCHNGYTGDKVISRSTVNSQTDRSLLEHKLLHDLSMSPTTSKKRAKVLKLLKDIPLIIDEASRERMFTELYSRGYPSGSDFSANLLALQWLNQNTNAQGKPWISTEELTENVRTLNEMQLENSALYNAIMYPNPNVARETTKQWFTQSCDFSTPARTGVNSNDRNSDGSPQMFTPSNPRDTSNASQQ